MSDARDRVAVMLDTLTDELRTNDERHPSARQVAQWFTSGHLAGEPRQVAQLFQGLMLELVDRLPDGPELTAGLRKLLEAKDCAVRAAVAKGRNS